MGTFLNNHSKKIVIRAKKVISILHHPFNYEIIGENRKPEVKWDVGASWVGIWRGDWPDLVASEIHKISDKYKVEVWRPEPRADQVYEYLFQDGVRHKSFPAIMKNGNLIWRGMMDQIREEISKGSIVVLNSLHPENEAVYDILSQFPSAPKLIQFHTYPFIPSCEYRKLRRKFYKNLSFYRLHRILKKNFNMIFFYNNSKNIDCLNKYSVLKTERVFMGCDLDFWKPVPKDLARRQLNIPKNTFVISLSSRLIPIKQIDIIIKIFKEIIAESKIDACLLIAGDGPLEYQDYLKNLAGRFVDTQSIRFLGFLDDHNNKLMKCASDLFVSASISEGGPVSVIKAMACNVPVFCTRVHGVDDILYENNAGVLLDPYDYKKWKSELVEMLKGKTIKILDRKFVEQYFCWANVAKKYIEALETLSHL